MAYEYTDSPVHGKILSQQGKILILPRQQAQQIAEQYNGNLVKSHNNRFMISLKECGGDSDCGCGCNSGGMSEPGVRPETYNQYPDHEVQMARQELYRTAKLALMLHDLLKNVGENQGLEGWAQAKLTRAADYIETVFSYMDYEMRYPSGMTEAGPTDQNTMMPGQTPAGTTNPPGTTPNKVVPRTPGLVKMAKIDTNGNVLGLPIMVPVASVKSKQQAGFHVIGESASSGASSAGGLASVTAVAAPMDGMRKRKKDTGSLFGGSFKQPNVKEDWETLEPGKRFGLANPRILTVGDDPQGIYDFAVSGNNVLSIRPFNANQWSNHQLHARNKGYMLKYTGSDPEKAAIAHAGETPRTGYNMAGEKLPEGLKDPKDNPCWKGYHPVGTKKKAGRTVPNCVPNESIEEAEYKGWVSNPQARMASNFMHDPDRLARSYKPNKYDPDTGLGGYVAPRGKTLDDPNIQMQLKKNLDSAKGKPLKFTDGSTLTINPKIARQALDKIDSLRPIDKHKAVKSIRTSKDEFLAFIKDQGMAEGKAEPKFTGYWKGKDKGKPGNKMVGDA